MYLQLYVRNNAVNNKLLDFEDHSISWILKALL